MANTDPGQAIIIKKIKKSGGGHHGGAWKVAYADFVTAMMAFFLLLWLLNAVTEDQLEGIANYFAPVTIASQSSGAGDILSGKTIAVEGNMQNMTSQPSVVMDLPPPSAGVGGADEGGKEAGKSPNEDDTAEPTKIVEDEATKELELLKKQEDQQFQKAIDQLREAIEKTPNMKQLAKSLLIDNTPEGMRIQIVDQEGLAMFPRGSSEMYLHTQKVLELVSKVVQNMPQFLSISGHTDATKYAIKSDYGNWELSADRANASRRALIRYGIPEVRISRVVGKSATEPLLPSDPNHASNRRLSIILLRGTGQQILSEPPPPPSEENKTKEKAE